jgi:hypothetical protein
MENDLLNLEKLGDKEAKEQGVPPGKDRNIWRDAIANELYEQRA